MTPIVLDASAGVEISLQTPLGLRLEDQLPEGASAWVPEHYYAEVAGVLRRNELNNRFPPVLVQLGLDRLLRAPVNRVSVKPLLSETWTMRHNLTVADALYVVIARHLDAPLVTADLRLAAAPNLPVVTITP